MNINNKKYLTISILSMALFAGFIMYDNVDAVEVETIWWQVINPYEIEWLPLTDQSQLIGRWLKHTNPELHPEIAQAKAELSPQILWPFQDIWEFSNNHRFSRTTTLTHEFEMGTFELINGRIVRYSESCGGPPPFIPHRVHISEDGNFIRLGNNNTKIYFRDLNIPEGIIYSMPPS